MLKEGQLLKRKLKGLDLTMEQAAAAVKLSRGTLYNYFSMEELDHEIKSLFKEKLNIDFEQNVQTSVQPSVDPKNLVTMRTGNIDAGTNISFQDSPDYIEGYVQVDGIGPNDGSWVVSGHSMHPTISKGCRVVIRKLENLDVIVWNEIYVVDLKEHGAKVKRLKPGKRKGSYVLVSDNKEYDPFEVTLEKDILGIYRVLMVFEMF